jgi:hypothetical protein
MPTIIKPASDQKENVEKSAIMSTKAWDPSSFLEVLRTVNPSPEDINFINTVTQQIPPDKIKGIWDTTIYYYLTKSPARLIAVKYQDKVQFFTPETFSIILSQFLKTLQIVLEGKNNIPAPAISRIVEQKNQELGLEINDVAKKIFSGGTI